MTIYTRFTPFPFSLNPNLLSIPIFTVNADYMLKITEWLEKKLLSAEFRTRPTRRILLMVKIKELRELYERAKDAEREAEGKTLLKAQAPFYRPRLRNRNAQRAFEELDNRRKISENDRSHNKVSKIRKYVT